MIASIFGNNREIFVSDGCIRNIPIFNTEVGQRCFEVMPCDTAVFSLKALQKCSIFFKSFIFYKYREKNRKLKNRY